MDMKSGRNFKSKACNPAITRLKQLLTQRSGFVNDKKAHEHRMKELLAMMEFKANDPMIKHYQKGS